MGKLIAMWPPRQTKYSLPIECSSCKCRRVVEPSRLRSFFDETTRESQTVAIYTESDLKTCSRCESSKVKVAKPKGWY